jgi:amino acid permease
LNTTKLECKIITGNVKLLVILTVLYIISIISVAILLYPGRDDSKTDIYVLEIAFCVFAFTALPIIPSIVNINNVITSEGIFQTKIYLFGLIKFSNSIPWSKVKSWDSSIFFNPMCPQQSPQLKLFLTKGFVRFDKLNKNFSCNNLSTDWDHFKPEFESLLFLAGIPKKTPELIRTQTRLLMKMFTFTTIVISILIFIGCILSIIIGKISTPLIYSGVIFSILTAGAITQFLKKK